MRNTSISIRAQMRLDALASLARLGPSTFVVSVINAAIVYYVLRDYANPSYLWGWVSIVVAFNALRVVMVAVFLRMPDEADYRTWAALYFILIYFTGLGWGVLPFFDVFYDVEWVEAFLVFVIAGMAAGGIVTLYVSLAAVIPYLLCILLPLIYVLARGQEPHHFAMSALAGLFLVLLIRAAYELNRKLQQVIRLEVENRDLFNFLVNARDEVEDARDKG